MVDRRFGPDLTGQVFGSWTVLERSQSRSPDRAPLWECRCICGTVRPVKGGSLRRGSSQSCGCQSPKRLLQLNGRRFGRGLALSRCDDAANGQTQWLCRCDCGTQKAVLAVSLISRKSLSCGCLRAEQISSRSTTHGLSDAPEYQVWQNMRQRCTDSKSKLWHRYGGRGITVDPRWQDSFEAFYADMGARPTPAHSIERIDLDGNYTPSNCVWATITVQMRNTSRSHRWTHEGHTATVAEWAERTSIPVTHLWARFGLGWPVDRILTEPVVARTGLTEDDVRSIRALRAQGWTNTDIAGRYGVSQPAISQIVNRRTWKHVG